MKKTGPKFYVVMALCVILPLITLCAPFLNGVFFVMYPAIIALIYKRKSPIEVIACVAAGLAATWFATYDAESIIILLCPAFLGFVLGHGFKIGKNFKTLILRGTTAFILPMVILICLSSNSINYYINEFFAELLNEAKMAAELNPDIEGTFVADAAQIVDQAKSLMLRLMPAMTIILGLIVCYLSILLAKFFLKMSGLRFVYVPSFAFLRLDRTVTAFMLVSSIMGMLPMAEKVAAAFENITLIMLALAFVCGLSVIDFYVRQRIFSAAKRFLLYSVTVLVSLMVSAIPITILCIIGIIDSFFKLRIVKTTQG